MKINIDEKLQNLYNMMREFYYEKNGLDTTINFLETMLYEFKKIQRDENNEQTNKEH